MTEFTYATLDGYDKSFSQGERLIDAVVTLGMNDLSSTCTLTVADPDGKIAQDLINHSLLNGGIQKLEATPPITQPPTQIGTDSTAALTPSGGQGVQLGADPAVTPEIRAMMDTVCYKETAYPLDIKGYLAHNGGGYYSDFPKDSWFPPAPGGINVGRYQFNSGDYTDAKAADPRIKGATPVDQDLICLYKFKYKGMLDAIKRGDIEGALRRANSEWTSVPGGTEDHGVPMSVYVAYYNQRLAYYKGGVQPPAKVDPTATQPVAPITTSTDNAIPVKGNKLTVYIGDIQYTFYHQGTEYDADKGITTLQGQSIRYALDRRKRSRIVHDTSLKTFAQSVADNHGVPLDWQVKNDIKYTVIDQRGVSDYSILLQQAKQSGVFLSDAEGKLTVKPLDAVEDSKLLFKWGYNISSAKFKDEALDGTKEDKSSALLQNEAKASLDPSSGNINQTKPDIDKLPDNSVTGNKAPVVAGQPVPGQELAQAQARSRVKRVQGLPSTIVVPLNPSTLALKPLSTIKTDGFVDVLNRMWVVDSVKHEPFKGSTTLSLYSPIETLDVVQDTIATPGTAPVSTAPLGQNASGYVYPMSNVAPFTDGGSWHNNRGTHLHAGVDFAGGSGGQPIIAIADGLAIIGATGCSVGDTSCGGGYGNYVDVDHGNGVVSRYAHMSSVSVSNGAQVKQGGEVGKCGNTGHSFGAHLHFEVFKKGHTFGSDTIKPDTLPGLSRLGIVGQTVTAGGKN